jgi:hypothetical protein
MSSKKGLPILQTTVTLRLVSDNYSVVEHLPHHPKTEGLSAARR